MLSGLDFSLLLLCKVLFGFKSLRVSAKRLLIERMRTESEVGSGSGFDIERDPTLSNHN